MTDLLIPDDSEADGNDLAHPAYWRGEKAGVVGVAMRWEDALTEPMPKPGVLGHPKLESLYRRTEALRKERDALEAAVKGMAKALRDEQARADAAEKERDEIQGVFDRGWAANMRGIKAWQAAHPGHDNVWPDKAQFTEWMLTRMTALENALNEVRPYVCGCGDRLPSRLIASIDAALATQDADRLADTALKKAREGRKSTPIDTPPKDES